MARIIWAIFPVVMCDPCIQLAAMLGLGDDTYTHGFMCHSQFWLDRRGSGRICLYKTDDTLDCPQRFPVTVTEAQRVLAGASVVASGPTVLAVVVTRQSEIHHTTDAPTTRPSEKAIRYSTPRENIFQTNTPVRRETRVQPVNINRHTIEVVAMGDCGVSEAALAPTGRILAEQFSSRDATFLLGDLFYPLGIDRGLGAEDPRIPKLISTLSTGNKGRLYALLGNHDRHGDWEAEVAFSKLNDKWVLPDRYHFQRLSKSGISVCAWFLDTDKMLFDETQKSWLQSSLDSEAPTCKWKVVSGHHFVFSGGEYEDNHWLLKHLLPILDTHKVHLYLAGHEHQSQAIKMSSHPTWFLIAGALGDLRDKPNRGHEGLLFINKADVAFLRLIFSENHIDFSFVKTYTPGPGTVLYSGSVPL